MFSERESMLFIILQHIPDDMDPIGPDNSSPGLQETGTHELKRWLDGFQASAFFLQLSLDEQSLSTEIIDDFSYYLWYYHDRFPGQWTIHDCEQVLLVDYPRSLVHSESYICAVPHVLSHFFAYLRSAGICQGEGSFPERMRDIAEIFYCRMDETKRWGPRKAFIYLALAAGVDGSEDGALSSFIYRFIQNQVPGKDEQTILSLSHILYDWLFPFSDSRQFAAMDPRAYRHAAPVISSMMRSLVVQSGISPDEWTPADIRALLSDSLGPDSRESGYASYIIPVLISFFSFLAEDNLQPHAREICALLTAMDAGDGVSGASAESGRVDTSQIFCK
jgi:hypothetical protein